MTKQTVYSTAHTHSLWQSLQIARKIITGKPFKDDWLARKSPKEWVKDIKNINPKEAS